MSYTANKKSKYCHTIMDIPLVPLTAESSTRFLAAGRSPAQLHRKPSGNGIPAAQPRGGSGADHPSRAARCTPAGDDTFLMEAGDVCIHPSNAIHGGKTTTGFKGIDIFIPPREDYLELMAKHGLPTKPAE